MLPGWKQPGMVYPALVPVAENLVLEFQARTQDTEVKNSPIGEVEEYPNGPVSVPMLGSASRLLISCQR